MRKTTNDNHQEDQSVFALGETAEILYVPYLNVSTLILWWAYSPVYYDANYFTTTITLVVSQIR